MNISQPVSPFSFMAWRRLTCLSIIANRKRLSKGIVGSIAHPVPRDLPCHGISRYKLTTYHAALPPEGALFHTHGTRRAGSMPEWEGR